MSWTSILKTKNTIQAHVFKTRLIESGIQAVVLDRVDHVYPVFGEVELRVQTQNTKEALNLINKKND
jgi:aspartate/glutamate racemase